MSIKWLKSSTLIVIIGLLAAFFCSCHKENVKIVKGETGQIQSPHTKITNIQPIRGGEIAEAMRWKKVTVLSPWVGEYDEPLLNYLKLIEDKEYNLETVLTSPFSDVPSIGDFHLFLLLGWSGSGLDEMRSATLDSVTISKKDIGLFLSRPEVQHDGAMAGTDDMKFIGWDVNCGQIAAGRYSVKLYFKRDLIRITAYPYSKEIERKDDYRTIKDMAVNVKGFE